MEDGDAVTVLDWKVEVPFSTGNATAEEVDGDEAVDEAELEVDVVDEEDATDVLLVWRGQL